MRMHRFAAAAWTVTLAVFLFWSPVFGQSTNEAGVRGTITDASGAVVPAAHITLTDVGTNIAHNSVSDKGGAYTFRALPPATYKMLVEASGFGRVEQDNITLTVNQQATLNVTLRPAAVASNVTVTAVPVLLETDDATLGTDVGSKYLLQIPLANRDPFGLTFLAGGVTETTGSGVADSYPAGTNFVSNGQRNATAEIRLDGNLTSSPEQGEGGTSNVYYQPSVEALQEFKVENNSFSAEYGNNGGTVVNTVMKSGTNQLHGSGWWYGQRSAFDARDFFNTGPVPDHQRDQYGFSIGGPIRKDHTFFFADLEIVRDRAPVNIVATVPTAQERVGDFSNTQVVDDNGNLVLNQIFNPFTTAPDGSRTAYAGNKIPQNQIDPIGQKLLNYYPKANQPGDPGIGTNNYRDVILSGDNSVQFDVKLDHNFSERSRLNARYSYLHGNGNTPTVFFDDIFNDGVNFTTDVYNDGLEYSYTPTANTLWISHFGIDRVSQPSFSKTPDPTSFGFPASLDQNGVSRMPAILPNSNGDYSRFTPLFSQCCVDTKFAHTLLNYSSAFSWTHGRHSIKFGGEQRLFYNNFFQPNYPTGLFSFDPTVSSSTPYDTNNGTEGNSFANILIGYGDTGSITVSRAVADRSSETAFYGLDNWKLTPRLTLTLGFVTNGVPPTRSAIIWNSSATSPPAAESTFPVWARCTGSTIFASGSQRTIPVDRNNLGAPSGLCLSSHDRTVVRGGAGDLPRGMNVATNFQYPGTAFSSAPAVFFTKDNYVTRYATLENPFPDRNSRSAGNKIRQARRVGISNGNNLDLREGTQRRNVL